MAGWKQVARRTADWVLPPGLEHVVRSSMHQMKQFNIADGTILQSNRVFWNRHSGERCFILATGPSIREQDLTPLSSENCFAVSNFFVHPDYAKIQPAYYCVAPWHEPVPESGWVEWLRDMESSLPGPTIPFFSLSDRERIEQHNLFSRGEMHYLTFGAEPHSIRAGKVDLCRPILAPQSVTVMALQIAIYMGFQYIYLLGCDHDWILHIDTGSHFYDEQQHTLNRAGYNEWFGADFESYCRDYIQLWQQYKLVKKAAVRHSVQIFNATAGGLLDVFPRVVYEDIINGKSHSTSVS